MIKELINSLVKKILYKLKTRRNSINSIHVSRNACYSQITSSNNSQYFESITNLFYCSASKHYKNSLHKQYSSYVRAFVDCTISSEQTARRCLPLTIFNNLISYIWVLSSTVMTTVVDKSAHVVFQ